MNNAPIRSRKGSLFVWGGLILVVLLIIVFGVLGKRPEQKVTPAEKAYPVRVMTVEPREIPDAVTLPGLVEPLKEATMGAERAGRIVELLVDQGARVKAGQVLLKMDSRVWEAQARKAEVEARDAERDLKRYKELEKTGAVSASEFDAIERRRSMAEIARDEARIYLSQCEARAPFDGVVNERLVELGDYAAEGQAVLRLIQTDRVKVAFDVPEQDIASVKPGDELTYMLTALPGRAFTGVVTFVSGRAARENNSFRVELENDNAGGLLRAGMIAQVTLIRRIRSNAVVIPLAAILPRKGEHLVFVVENGRALRRRVHIDALIGHEAVLSEGLNPGERLVVEGHRGLQDGLPVEVVGPAEPREP